MPRALVTGGTSFVGSHLVRRLLREGHAVHVLGRPGSDPWRIRDVLADVRLHAANLLDREAVRQAVRSARPDHVFHLAAAPVVAGVTGGGADVAATNFLGTVNLIDACEAVDYLGLVTTGDAFEYGPRRAPLCESAPGRPDSWYGITKLRATLYAQKTARSHGRPIVTLRPFSIYGPGDRPCRLVPQVIAGALRGAPIALSRPEIARDWLYVEDVVELFLEASRGPELGGRVFNAGSGRATTIAELVTAVSRLTGSDVDARWGSFPAAPHDAWLWVADMRCTHQAFRWRPYTSFDEGLLETIDAIARQPAAGRHAST